MPAAGEAHWEAGNSVLADGCL